MSRRLKPAEQKLAIRKFTRQQRALNESISKQQVLALAEGSIPDALWARTRDSNLSLIYAELTRAKLGRPFKAKHPRRRPSIVTPAVRDRIEALYSENPFGCSYRTIANQLQSEGTKIGKDTVGKILKEFRVSDATGIEPSPGPPPPLRTGYNWPPSPVLGPREQRAIQQWFKLPPRRPEPPPPFEMEYRDYPIQLPVKDTKIVYEHYPVYVGKAQPPSPDHRPVADQYSPLPSKDEAPYIDWHLSDFEENTSILEPMKLRSDAYQRKADREAAAKIAAEKANAKARRARIPKPKSKTRVRTQTAAKSRKRNSKGQFVKCTD